MALDLAAASERTLSLLATAVAGAPVTVVATGRVEAPACASFARRTIWIDPARTGPYDLVLLAGLLRDRRGARRLVRGLGASRRVRRHVARVAAALAREFPALSKLPGRWQDTGPDAPPPALVWDTPKMNGLELDGGGELRASLVPGERLDGVEGDLGRLLEAVEDGRVPLRTHPGMPGVPWIEVPLTLRTHERPREETPEERDVRLEVDEFARGLVSCYENKTAGATQASFAPARASGARLDPRRLHEVAVALRTGRPARPFRRPPVSVQATFRPEQHAAVLGFDAPSLHRAVGRRGRVRMNLLRGFAKTFELMEIDCVVVGFRDRLLSLPSGGFVYVHMPCVAKALDEPFTAAVWQRLESLWTPFSGPGRAACSVALQIDTLAAHAREAAQVHERRFLTYQYMSVSGLPDEVTGGGSLSASAAAAGDTLEALERDVEAEWSISAFVPQALINAAPPGSMIARQSDLGI